MVHDIQQLRVNFGCLQPSQVPLDQVLDVNVNVGNEFGLFRRDYESVFYLQCSLRINTSDNYELAFQNTLDGGEAEAVVN
ncbi:hypothetical protein F443_02904 [Phytophthora nicotianae P1569]|uniref:ZP domain-containing protein n=2 Tax=Phytophthora nicotianae TaxID=4792 RepID=V9FV42_PHYNI|nr:hypothetical protein F443_02904 [Phytophthora nicotianae P1569]